MRTFIKLCMPALLLLAFVCSLLILAPQPASASEDGSSVSTLASVDQWQLGDGATQVHFGMVMDPSTGHLHITNTREDVIDVFTVFGEFVESYGLSWIGGHSLDYPADVAIMDNSIYVTYWNSNVIVQYDRSTRAHIGHAPVTGPVGLTAGDGEVYVTERTAGQVAVFDANLTRLRTHEVEGYSSWWGSCGNSPNDVAVFGDTLYVLSIDVGQSCGRRGIWQGTRSVGSTADATITGSPFYNGSTYSLQTSATGQLFATSLAGAVMFENGVVVDELTSAAGQTGLAIDPAGDSLWMLRRGGAGGALFAATRQRCHEQVPTVVGTSADDIIDLTGKPAGQVVWAGEGVDVISGQSGHTVCQPFQECASVGFVAVYNPGVSQAECDALAALYRDTNGAQWANRDGWGGIDHEPVSNFPPHSDRFDDICRWHGVTCDVLGQLTEIDLNNNGLVGTLPAALGDLANLRSLDLGWNQLTGQIPAQLGDLRSLLNLRLLFNEFTGEIPAELGNLANLRSLMLVHNQLTGNIPDGLDNLSSLTALGLSGNDLVATDLGTVLDGLPRGMRNLGLAGVNLQGPIPEWIGEFDQLRILDLPGNDLTGALPESIGNFTAVTWFDVSDNNLTGAIPPSIGNLSEVVDLRLHTNELSGGVPDTIQSLTQMTSVQLGSNGCLTASAATTSFLAGFGQDAALGQNCV